MSIWSILRGNKHIADKGNVISNTPKPISHDTCKYVFIDVEVGLKDQVIHDIGALRHDGLTFHKASKKELYPLAELT